MRIGIAATRLAGVDGVTFEVAKWEEVLERMGHEVRLLAGDVDALRPHSRLVPAMHFTHPPAARVTAAAFDADCDASSVRREIDRLAEQLAPVIEAWMDVQGIRLLIVENAWAIPMHLPLAVALRRVVQSTGIPAIGHHHDYWWERERFAGCIVPDVLDEAFPPNLPGITHASINSLAALELRRRRGVASSVIPNVFDFSRGRPRPHPAIRRRLRAELGMGARGLLVIQPTRVVPRKGIELAIDLVARLRDRHAVLLITSPAGDEGLEYLVEMQRLAKERGVDLRYAADRFAPDLEGKPLRPAHSLHDAYLAADLVTYPSLYEGYGNALVEAIYYGKPVVVNRYSVYEADIAPLGFRLIEIDGAITPDTVREVKLAVADPARQGRIARHNFEIARRHLSYEVLQRRLARFIRKLTVASSSPG
jgi:glycosyltransferase involved in cell wall biosynthesis